MSGFYVLDVPEFGPVVSTARKLDRCHVHLPLAGYIFVQFDGEIEISRADTGLNEAVWFGCLTGGLDGKIVTFDSDCIRLGPTNEAILGEAR